MVAEFGREVWKHVSWDENRWRTFGEAKVREVLAGHVREAGRLEEEAVGLVERLLKRLGQSADRDSAPRLLSPPESLGH